MVKNRQHIKLFYFEIFVDNITFYESERDWVDTILTISYIENHELVVKESKLDSSHVYGKDEDTVIFQGGRSCVFCIEPKLLNNLCSLELIVSRKSKSGDVIQIGSTKVSLGGTYGDLLNGEEEEKVKKIVQDTRLLRDKDDISVGSITFAAQLFFYSRIKTGKSEEKLNFLKFQSNAEGVVSGDTNANCVMFNLPKKMDAPSFEPYIEESDESLALSVMESAINELSKSQSNDFNFPQIFPDQLSEIESSFAKGDSFNDEKTFQEEKQYPLKEKKPNVLLTSGNWNYQDDQTRVEDYPGHFKSPFIFNPKAAMKDPYEKKIPFIETHPTIDSRKAYQDNKTRDRSSLSLGYYHGKKRTTYQDAFSQQENPAQRSYQQKSGFSRPKVNNFANNPIVGRKLSARDFKKAQTRPHLSPITLPSMNNPMAFPTQKYSTPKHENQQRTNMMSPMAKEVPKFQYVQYPYPENGKATKVKQQDASTNTNSYQYPTYSPNVYSQTKATNTNQDMATNTYKYVPYPQYSGHKHKTNAGYNSPNSTYNSPNATYNSPNASYNSPNSTYNNLNATYNNPNAQNPYQYTSLETLHGYGQKPNSPYSPTAVYSPLRYVPKQHVEEPQLNSSTRQIQYQNYSPKNSPVVSPPTYNTGGRTYERNINTPRYITPQEAYTPYTYGHYANWSPPAPIPTKYEYPTQSAPYYYYRANGMDPQVPKFNSPYRV